MKESYLLLLSSFFVMVLKIKYVGDEQENRCSEMKGLNLMDKTIFFLSTTHTHSLSLIYAGRIRRQVPSTLSLSLLYLSLSTSSHSFLIISTQTNPHLPLFSNYIEKQSNSNLWCFYYTFYCTNFNINHLDFGVLIIFTSKP